MAATTTLALGDDLALPVDALTRTTAIVGQRGTGKTSTAVVLVEEAARVGAQFAVVDPTGAWFGLRSSADGDGPGLEAVVFGGHHGDVPLEHEAGAYVARLIVEQGLSVVLDLELMTKGKQVQFVAEFAEELYHRNRTALALVMDEAHRFAPQQLRDPGGYGARCLGAVTDVVTLGRRKGLGAVLISQRPAKINKDVFEQAEVMVAHRLMGPNDRKAIAGWLDETGAADDREVGTQPDAVRSLDRGQAIVYAPAYDVYGRFTIRAKQTFDSSATPEVGATVVEPRGRADVDLGAIEQAMAETIERAKADDPRALRRQIKELEAQLADRPETAAEPQVVWPFTDEEFDRAIQEAEDAVEHATRARELVESLTDYTADSQTNARRLLETVRAWSERKGEEVAALDKLVNVGAGNLASRGRPPAPRPAPKRAPSAEASNGDGPTLKAGARRILVTLARHHPMRFTRAQVGTLTGFKVTGGTFQTYWGVLKRAGYVEETGGEIVVTDAGLDRAGVVPEAPTTTEELVAMWGERLKKGAREMLDCLVDAYPQALARGDLAKRVGMTASGGTFQTYLGTLRRNGLAETADGEVRAADVLFIISGSVA